MTNREIILNINGLAELQKVGRDFPIKVSFTIAKNLDKLLKCYEPYEQARQKLFAGYDEMTKEEKEEKDKQLQELLDVDNEDITIQKIKLSDIESCENLSAKEMTALLFMMEE